jgi:hypothetical protein
VGAVLKAEDVPETILGNAPCPTLTIIQNSTGWLVQPRRSIGRADRAAAAPIVAVLLLGVGEGQTGALQTALTLPFILFAIPPACWRIVSHGAG